MWVLLLPRTSFFNWIPSKQGHCVRTFANLGEEQNQEPHSGPIRAKNARIKSNMVLNRKKSGFANRPSFRAKNDLQKKGVVFKKKV
jgi:hypothetical protein